MKLKDQAMTIVLGIGAVSAILAALGMVAIFVGSVAAAFFS